MTPPHSFFIFGFIRELKRHFLKGNKKQLPDIQRKTAAKPNRTPNKAARYLAILSQQGGESNRHYMNRDDAREYIRQNLSCTNYLTKSKGTQYCCPFCGSGTGKSKTGALTYYPKTNTFTCFSCHKSGDIYDIIQEVEQIDFNKALSLAADRLNISIDDYSHTDATQRAFKHSDDKTPAAISKAPQKPTESATEDYTEYYKQCELSLKDSKEALSYLAARGISYATAARCHLGFDAKADPAKSNHPTPRVIIPTCKSHYVGRAIIETDKAYKKLNVKGGSPYIFNAAALTGDSNIIYVTEGAFDALSLLEIGKEAIALNSTGNTRLLIDYLTGSPQPEKAFIICFDNDTDKTAETTTQHANDLLTQLRAMGYKAITYNVAGSENDINDLLQHKGALYLAEQAAAAESALNRDALTEFFEKIQTEAYKPYKTDLQFFDDLLNGGIIPQSLLVLMAAPAAGKTTLCQQIAEQMALHRKPVIYLNLEMSKEQMLAKALSGKLSRTNQAQLSALDILQGYKWTSEQRTTIVAALDDYRARIFPYMQYNPDDIGSDLDSILSYLTATGERAKAAGKAAPAVIVDYLHLITTKRGLETAELIKQIVKGLKDYAVNYDTFVILISATNRTSNTAGKITLESGRDSSAIEYTGDYQLSLNYYDIDTGKVKPDDVAELQREKWRRMVIRVLKGRFTPPQKTARVYFNAAYNSFYGEYGDFMPVDTDRVEFPPQEEQPTQQKNAIRI